MDIIGGGMIARSLAPYANEFADTVVFACGVADSSEQEQIQFLLEYDALYRVLKTCHDQDKRIVYFSSGGAVYGHTDAVRREITPTYPDTPYGRHKLLCETLVRNSAVQHIILRLPNLVGEGQNPRQLIPMLVGQIKQGHVTVFNRASRDLLDVEDMALILVQLLEAQRINESFLLNVASKQSVMIADIVWWLQTLLNRTPDIHLREIRDIQRFDTRTLLYSVIGLPFPDFYYRNVLRKYVHADVPEQA